MKIIDLINRLQALYETYDQEYKNVMGEPEIGIDVFLKRDDGSHCFTYGGFIIGMDIIIEKSPDGVYDVLTAFAEPYDLIRKKQ